MRTKRSVTPSRVTTMPGDRQRRYSIVVGGVDYPTSVSGGEGENYPAGHYYLAFPNCPASSVA